ncbi:MAG: hypothetical protein WHU93_02090 [Arcobacteraceae bacterium]
MKNLKILISIVLSFSFLYASSVSDKRKEVLQDSKDSLSMLYKLYPSSKKFVSSSYGYATFSNIGVNLVLFSAELGRGVAHNNKTGKNTYMKMVSGGVGFGLGVKDFRAIFVFETKEAFDFFVEHGWEANAQADAVAKSDNKGGSLEGAITVHPGIKLYKLTKNGLALQATIQGTKYWRDDELNY